MIECGYCRDCRWWARWVTGTTKGSCQKVKGWEGTKAEVFGSGEGEFAEADLITEDNFGCSEWQSPTILPCRTCLQWRYSKQWVKRRKARVANWRSRGIECSGIKKRPTKDSPPKADDCMFDNPRADFGCYKAELVKGGNSSGNDRKQSQ